MSTFNMQGLAVPAALPMPGVHQGFGGAMGLTLSGSPPSTATPSQGTAPSGSTPNAKRPHRVMALSDGPVQPVKPMTNEDVSNAISGINAKILALEA